MPTNPLRSLVSARGRFSDRIPPVQGRLIARLLPFAVAGIAAGALVFWLGHDRLPGGLDVRIPGTDRPPGLAETTTAPVNLAGTFANGPGSPLLFPSPTLALQTWPGFRGAKLDGVSDEAVDASAWSTHGPAKLWQIDVGEGYASPAIANGRAYLLDYDTTARADVLRCLSMGDGQDIWRRSYPSDVKRNHGYSRTVPAVADGVVVTVGPRCQVLCVDADSGDYRWGIDLVRQYGTKVPPWYAGQCPLIDQGKVILAPAGRSLMIAVDCKTGKVVWETPNPRAWEMTHSSIVPVEFAGRRMYVYCGSGGVAGVDAASGELLWETTAWRSKIALVPTPVVLDGGRILLSAGYDAGCMMIQLTQEDGHFVVKTLWTRDAKVFGAEQQTPIWHKGYIYGVVPGGQLVCLDVDGNQKWNSGAQKFGIGPYMIAGDTILLMNDGGTLTAAEATSDAYRPMGSWPVFQPGHEAWGPMSLAGGRLIVRDLRRMACLEMGR